MKVFLSYSRQNETAAQRLFSELKAPGVTVWLDREALLPGQNWQSEVTRAISESDTVVLLLSSQSVDRRGYFLKEMRLALEVLQTIPEGRIYLLPVRLDDCLIPGVLSAIQVVDLFRDYETGLRKIIAALEFQRNLHAKTTSQRADASGHQERLTSVLIVNDEPASMNAVAQTLKLAGASVNYAPNVPQAIEFIQENRPDVVISDLSHYSSGVQITHRAAFEILEWGRRDGSMPKLIVTCAEMTAERRQEAVELGAVGICNSASELYRYFTEITGLEIPNDLLY